LYDASSRTARQENRRSETRIRDADDPEGLSWTGQRASPGDIDEQDASLKRPKRPAPAFQGGHPDLPVSQGSRPGLSCGSRGFFSIPDRVRFLTAAKPPTRSVTRILQPAHYGATPMPRHSDAQVTDLLPCRPLEVILKSHQHGVDEQQLHCRRQRAEIRSSAKAITCPRPAADRSETPSGEQFLRVLPGMPACKQPILLGIDADVPAAVELDGVKDARAFHHNLDLLVQPGGQPVFPVKASRASARGNRLGRLTIRLNGLIVVERLLGIRRRFSFRPLEARLPAFRRAVPCLSTAGRPVAVAHRDASEKVTSTAAVDTQSFMRRTSSSENVITSRRQMSTL